MARNDSAWKPPGRRKETRDDHDSTHLDDEAIDYRDDAARTPRAAESTTMVDPAAPAQPETGTESTDSDARRGDREYHLARVRAGFSTTVTDPERARRLARLLNRGE